MVIRFDERIKALRLSRDMTQTELARLMTVTRSSVNAWEMAVSIPSTEKLTDLCAILHTTADYLLGLDTSEKLPVDQYNETEKEILYRLVRYFDEARRT